MGIDRFRNRSQWCVIRDEHRILKFKSINDLCRYLEVDNSQRSVVEACVIKNIDLVSIDSFDSSTVTFTNGDVVDITNIKCEEYDQNIIMYNCLTNKAQLVKYPAEAKTMSGVSLNAIINACNTKRSDPVKNNLFRWLSDYHAGYRFNKSIAPNLL